MVMRRKLVEQLLKQPGIYARRGDEGAQTIDSQNAEGKEHPLAQVGNSEDIEKLFQHG
jgi:hypothetical protein